MKETLKNLREKLLPVYGKNESDAIIRLIFHYLKGWSQTDMIIHADDELSPFIKQEIKKILSRLENHEPIQYIVGEARFNGLDFKVNPDVLIPRPETSELVDIITEDNKGKEDLHILDIGTGSGAIAIALARSLKFPSVTAIDISQKALEVAKENAKRLKVNVNFFKNDILKSFPKGKYDIIVSNPPYVLESEKKGMQPEVLLYEPSNALFVKEEEPLIFYKAITDFAKKSLSEGGGLYYEINPLMAQQVKHLMIEKGFKNVEILLDFYGKKRFVKGFKWNN